MYDWTQDAGWWNMFKTQICYLQAETYGYSFGWVDLTAGTDMFKKEKIPIQILFEDTKISTRCVI